MKKFLLSIVIAMMGFIAVNAQEMAYVSPKWYDNTYIGVTVGAQQNMNDIRFKAPFYPTANIYLGKWFTPYVGVELNGEASFHDNFRANTTFVNGSYVGLNGTVNLSNIILGYPGKSHNFEVIPFAGLGWMHAYGDGTGELDADGTPKSNYNDPQNLTDLIERNALATKFGVNLAWNLGKTHAWQINVRPHVSYVLSTGVSQEEGPARADIVFDKKRGRIGLEAGITYKFANHDKRHDFTKKLMIDYDKYETLLAENEALKNQGPKIIEKTHVVEKVSVVSDYVVNFAKGDATVGDITAIAQELKNTESDIVITGYTSPEGSEELNKKLGQNRAENVKAALVKAGIPASRISVVNGYNNLRAATISLVK